MPLLRKLTALAGVAEAARRYARKNPDQAAKFVDQAAQFVDKQTKGKFSSQIRGAAGKVKGAVGSSGSQAFGTRRHGGPANGSAPGYGAAADREFRPGR